MNVITFVLVFSAHLIATSGFKAEDTNYMAANQQGRSLFFPQYTTLQLSMASVIPIVIKDRKIAVNLGFQVNYNLPYQLKDFYSPIFWAARSIFNPTEIVYSGNNNLDSKYQTNSTGRIKRDLSAGQLYSSLRQALELSGYDEECLLKSVCELARLPLHEDKDNLISEVMHYILTPSLHQAFDENEDEEREAFEAAEEYGKNHGDCHLLYPDCVSSPLDHITNVVDEIE